jgi:exodeoxyribonuclease V gamma subunit
VLHVHRAERADALATALAELLLDPLDDPFTAEVVAVPARGIERWLAHRLAHRLGAGPDGDGVCAGVSFPSPTAVVEAVLCGAAGADPDDDPWRPARSVWPLLEVVDEAAGEAWCAPLSAHLGLHAARPDAARHGRRYSTARRLVELFASYASHRPAMLRAWLAGDDGEVPADLRWQPELWRRLRARIGEPGPAERLETACAALRAGPAAIDVPPRLSLFGPTRLPADHLAVLASLAAHREVHLWLPHPSPALWKRVRPRAAVPRRREDDAAEVPRHPLLSSLGRDVRELQVRLPAGATDHHHPLPEPPDTLLGRLQRDLRDDHPPGAAAVPPAPGDRSVQVHACHGPTRQVEVLREVVLGLLAADPTLEPRDVLVMCPDVETFAPLVSAAFGLDTGDAEAAAEAPHPGQRLRVRLADRALRQVNPLLDTVSRLLELADARLTASQVLDLLGSGPVRRRFRLDDADLGRLRELAVRAGVRWGLDGAHRRPFRLDGFPQNTWAAGLDRMLTGVAMSADGHDWLGTALPLDDVDSGEVELVGTLAEFVDRLAALLAELSGVQPLATWVAALSAGLDALTDTAPADAWQAAQARGELAAAARAAGPHAGTVPLGLADIRSLLAERLRGRPSRANFRTGTLTVATLVPMRSVPHRVVCLLGLDDGVFPRAGAVDGDDVLARDPLVGERDVRSEDRQLLLDAICAATEHLVVLYSGADERTGARRPPAVPLGELLDTIAATGGDAAREAVVVRHPLQPFDARNFTPGALVPGPFSFDRAELGGALAATGPKAPPAAFLRAPLPPPDGDVVELDDLVAFLEHPTRAFLRDRVGLPVSSTEDDLADALPIAPGGLTTWGIGERLLRDRLAGWELDRCRQAEWRRGELPPGPLGAAVLQQVTGEVEQLVGVGARVVAEVGAGEPRARDVAVALPDGTRVTGTVTGLHGDRLVRVEYSRLGPKHRLRAWVRLLALAVGHPEVAWRAVTVGRAFRGGPIRSTLGPVEPERATAVLADLVALHREGLCAPLPLGLVSGHHFARTLAGGASEREAAAEAAKKWTTGVAAEGADDAHRRVWGAEPDTAVVTGSARFPALALRVWGPLLGAESEDRP